MEQAVLSATGASSPAWTWGGKEFGIDLAHPLIYIGVTSAAFGWLSCG